MSLAVRGHLATMNILHGDFRFFGDNIDSPAAAAAVSALATRGWSDSRLGGALVPDAKIKALLHAGADLLTTRAFGLDFDGCRALGRYLIEGIRPPFHSIRLLPPSAGPLRKQPPAGEDESGPVPSPEEGRGRSLSPRIVQDEFPAHISAGVCR